MNTRHGYSAADVSLDPVGSRIVRVYFAGEFRGVCLPAPDTGWRFYLFDNPAVPSGPRTVVAAGDTPARAVAAYFDPVNPDRGDR